MVFLYRKCANALALFQHLDKKKKNLFYILIWFSFTFTVLLLHFFIVLIKVRCGLLSSLKY